jgi:outer membrane protein TolC
MRHWLVVVLGSCPVLAQPALTLEDAVRTTVRQHPEVQVRTSETRAAEARIVRARSGYLPKVNYSESFARSDNPVFVFSSLLTQRQFTEENFAIDRLNRPDFLNNFQSMVTVEQTIYDWGGTGAQVRSAELFRNVSKETQRRTEMHLIARTVRAYYGALLARATLDSARAAMKSAEADLARAESFRRAGMSTDADVLSIRVHLAGVREGEIRRSYDLRVAMAALNEVLGLPLETEYSLVTPLTPAKTDAETAARFEAAAAENRPELKQAALAGDIAQQQRTEARSALLPQFGVRGVFEADRQRFANKGGANWLFGASIRWSLFDGNAARARISEAEAAQEAARARQREAAAGVQLEVQRAWADYRSADERIAVTSAAVAQAEESLRITKNRYEAGLSTVTDLLRTETALLDTRTRRLAAIHDQRIAAAQLELAAGTLSPDSEVLK